MLDSFLWLVVVAIVVVYAATLRNAGPALVIPTIIIPIIALVFQMIILAGSCRVNGWITRDDTGVASYRAVHECVQIMLAVALFVFGISDAAVVEMREELIGCAGFLTVVAIISSRVCVRMNILIQANCVAMFAPEKVQNVAFTVTDDDDEDP